MRVCVCIYLSKGLLGAAPHRKNNSARYMSKILGTICQIEIFQHKTKNTNKPRDPKRLKSNAKN